MKAKPGLQDIQPGKQYKQTHLGIVPNKLQWTDSMLKDGPVERETKEMSSIAHCVYSGENCIVYIFTDGFLMHDGIESKVIL